MDVNSNQSISNLIAKINLDHGEISVLVNNAGITRDTLLMRMKEEDWDAVINTNLKSVYKLSQAVIKGMMKKRYGRIINISSVVGIIPDPTSPAYCSTKAALIMLTKCMAREYGVKGVRVNAILPGPIDTPLLRRFLSSEESIQKYAALNPMGRIGKPEEIANVAAFLASDEASYVTGGIYSVDGGQSC
jgi:3-oxoacyl-[acyl-carrier protein] reductase